MVSSSSSSSSSSSNKRSKKPKRSKSFSPERRQAPAPASSSTSSPSSAKTPTNPPPPFLYPPPSPASSTSSGQSLVILVGPKSSCSSAPAVLTTTLTTTESGAVAGIERGRWSTCSAESQWRPKKRRGLDKLRKFEVDSPIGKDPKCIVCGRVFISWRAYFGHLRTHPERQWRGAYPPNELTDEVRRVFEQELAPTLLGIATAMTSRIDLNVPPPVQRRLSFDLNRSPPPEEDEDDNNNNKGDGN